MMKKKMVFILIFTFISALFIAGCSNGEVVTETDDQSSKTKTSEVQLPNNLVISVDGVGSSGYADLTAISDAMADKYGTEIRMFPSDTGVGRIQALTSGRAVIGGRLGDEVFFAFEGTEEFASKQLGPQPMRYLYPIPYGVGMAVPKDSDIKTVEDLRGKKVPYVIGNPSLNVKAEALLASGGLTWDDVEIVEITSGGVSAEMIFQGALDVTSFLGINNISIMEANESKGIRWLDFSHLTEDEEALKNLQAVYPFGYGKEFTSGVAASDKEPVNIMGYNSYSPAALATVDADLIYNWLKALDETYDVFSNATATLKDWNYELTDPKPLGVPLHEGAIRFYKEKGMWTEEYEQRNNELLEREQQLQKAWETVLEESIKKGLKDKDFNGYWLQRRQELLD